MKLQPDPTGSDNLYMVTHLSVSVAKCDGDDEALEAVEDYVKVFVSGLPLAVRVFLRPEVIKGLMNVTRNPARTLNIMGDAIAIVFLHKNPQISFLSYRLWTEKPTNRSKCKKHDFNGVSLCMLQ